MRAESFLRRALTYKRRLRKRLGRGFRGTGTGGVCGPSALGMCGNVDAVDPVRAVVGGIGRHRNIPQG